MKFERGELIFLMSSSGFTYMLLIIERIGSDWLMVLNEDGGKEKVRTEFASDYITDRLKGL